MDRIIFEVETKDGLGYPVVLKVYKIYANCEEVDFDAFKYVGDDFQGINITHNLKLSEYYAYTKLILEKFEEEFPFQWWDMLKERNENKGRRHHYE